MSKESLQEKLRSLPSVEELLESAELKSLATEYSRPIVAKNCRQVLADTREKISAAGNAVAKSDISAEVKRLVYQQFLLKTQAVINATGIILHTNLGRAPLSSELLQNVSSVASSYNNLEFVLDSGQRGQRGALVEELLSELTGAESACVVNNNAGAMFLILSALAKGKEVIVSRGELVQIGGGFKIPEILKESGAILREVGTTNQTTLPDYENALTEKSAIILKVHHSNFKMQGFVREVPLRELSELAKEKNLKLVYDQGSGAVVDTRQFGLAKEPMVQEGLKDGADLVAFSGDKLLGGPQAGIVVGKPELVNQLKRHSLYRALRPGKFTLTGLEETAIYFLKSQAVEKIPIWRMISQPLEEIKKRTEKMIAGLKIASHRITSIPTTSFLGGGSLPEQGLPSFAVAIGSTLPLEDISRRFRLSRPAVVGRISQEQFLLDLRSVFPEQDSTLASIISQVLT